MKRIRMLAFASLAGLAAAAQAQVTTLRLDTFLPPGGFLTRPGTGVFDTWGAMLEKDSGGTLKLQVNPGGTLGAAGRDPGAQLKLVTDGVTDVTFVIPTTTPGRFPDDNLFGLPVASNSMEASLAFWRLHQAGMMRGYGGEAFHIVGLVVNPPNTLHTRVPVSRLEDLKGLKMQSSGQMQQELLRALGTVPVGTVTVRDTAEAMSRGVVDGTPKDWLALVNFRIGEVALHHVDYPLGQATILIAMNRARLNGLAPAAKAAVEKNSGEPFVRLMAGRFDGESGSYHGRIKNDAKHRIVTLPEAERKRWDEAMEKVVADWRKADPVNDKLWQAFQRTLAEVRADLKSGR
jgi:TRAP-type C4-dicarboxylate transport system substrate-binding protein